ncbi:DUF4124 domain-containing protein [Undibacterium sp. TJN25]|uniref:DUF4124 domain-containing protein n=1 Tax=Undibacterium sp. TJN25 TaxID=3413056 RepID=UPI003BF18D5D
MTQRFKMVDMKTFILAILLFASGVAAAAVNVCIDADGKKTFTDQECAKLTLKDLHPKPVVVAPVQAKPTEQYHAPIPKEIIVQPSIIKEAPGPSIWFVRHRTDYPLLILIGAFLFPVVFIVLWYVFDFGNRRRRRLSVEAAAKP